MSPLTRTFVVLLVILSVAFTAGTVVFFNKVEDYKRDSTAKTEALSREQAAKAAAQAGEVQATAMATKVATEAQSRTASLNQALNTAVAEQQRLQGEVAQAQLAKSQAEVNLSTAVGAQKSAQDALKATEAAYIESRKQNDDLSRKYNESMVGVSDLTNRLDVITRRYEKAQEDQVALNSELDRLRQTGGARPAAPGAGAMPAPGGAGAMGAPGGAPAAGNIRGVIRNRRNIGGVEYATVSVGSNDSVVQGTRFRVVDQGANRFLGYLDIVSVNDKESTGRLTPATPTALQSIGPNTEVLTQIQ